MRISFLCLLVLLSSVEVTLSQTKTAEVSQITHDSLGIVPIDVAVPDPPTVFEAHERWNLCYELRISSFADKGDLEITSVAILGPNHEALVSISGNDLKGSIDPQAAVGTTLKPRTYTTVFMWLSASSPDDIRPVLRHRVNLKSADDASELSTETPEVAVDRRPVMVIDPPLRGDGWEAVNGPSNSSLHRRAILPVNGTAFIGQKYAIDWAQSYPDGKLSHGDDKVNKNFRSYGQPVYAVADGTITESKDGVPENVPGDSRAVEITMDSAPGNHVIEQIGEHAYAAYAHMQPGSVRVKLGDRVKSGQVLGLVGNSGNATGPHLHFQVCDANSFLVCNGIPYAISSFEVQASDKPGTVARRQRELPVQNDLINFAAPPAPQ